MFDSKINKCKNTFGMMLLAGGLLILPSAHAQDDFDFDEEALIVDEVDDGGIRISQFLFGEIGTIYGQGGGITRQNAVFNVGVDIPWDNGRLFAKYGGVNFSLSYTQELLPGLVGRPEALGRPLERNIERTVDDFDLREGFLQQSLGSFATLSFGRINNVWGQFELLTPSMMMLPTTANITSLTPNKVDYFTAQDQVRLSVFPHPKMEIQLHAMADIQGDAAREDNVLLWLPPLGTPEDFKFQDKHKEDTGQQAARMIFYPRWGTFGFTWHKGVNAYHPILRTDVAKFGNSGIAALARNEDISGRLPDSDPSTNIGLIASVYENEDESYLFYPEGELVAFEFSIPVGQRWVWRGEFSQVETLDALGYFGDYTINRGTGTGPNDSFTPATVTNFFDAINDPQRSELMRGTSLYQSTRTFSAFGFLYQGPIPFETPLTSWLWKRDTPWILSGTILVLSTEPNGEQAQKILQAFDDLWTQQPNASEDTPNEQINFTLPLFTALRFAGEDKQHRFGIITGILGNAFGAAGLYSYNVSDDLAIGITAGPLDLGSGQEGDLYYRLKKDDGLAGQLTTQVSLSWRF